jgi:hypothetical protein
MPGAWWVHNDSGDGARVFAIGADGAVRGEVTFAGARAVDFEDIATGAGPDGRPHVFVADVGDNHFRRSDYAIWHFPEPASLGATQQVAAQRVALRYDDGATHNVECLLADPRTGELLLVTKEPTGTPSIFAIAAADIAAGSAVACRVGTLPIGAPRVTGGDVSADGARIVVRTYEGAYLWRRQPGQRVEEALAAPPQRIDAPYGEAVAFSPDGRSLVSIAEGRDVHLWRRDVPGAWVA